MNEETKKLLNWLINDGLQYKQKLRDRGLYEAEETADIFIKIMQQFLDNPNKINNI